MAKSLNSIEYYLAAGEVFGLPEQGSLADEQPLQKDDNLSVRGCKQSNSEPPQTAIMSSSTRENTKW